MEEAKVAAKVAADRRSEDSRATGLLFAPGQSGCITSESLDPICASLSGFKPVTLTVNSFFKQVSVCVCVCVCVRERRKIELTE